MDCDANYDPCASSTGSGNSSGGYDYDAARRAQEAAEQQRRQEEAARIERERLAEEKRRRDAAFIRDRDAAAGTLKGSSGTNTSGLKGLSGSDSHGLKGSGSDAGAQLKSVERHSRQAQAQRNDADKRTSAQGFDTSGKASGTLVYPDKNKYQQVRPSALERQVPAAAQKDPQVQQSLAWYRSLDAQKAEKERKVAEMKQQQKASKDPSLDMKIATLNNDVKRLADDQAKATETVKKRVKDMGLEWNETPAPAAAKKQ